jgi:hypothetical protein
MLAGKSHPFAEHSPANLLRPLPPCRPDGRSRRIGDLAATINAEDSLTTFVYQSLTMFYRSITRLSALGGRPFSRGIVRFPLVRTTV